MKAGNRLELLHLIRRSPIARSEMAKETGLTRAAISLIVAALEAEGLVFERGRRESPIGRQPVLVELNPEYAYSLGMTINRRLRSVPVHLSPLGERPELMAAADIVTAKFFQGQLEPETVPVSLRAR